EAVEVDGLEHNDLMTSCRAWLAALRGDTETADRLLAGLTDMRASEDVQDRARISVIEAHAAVGHRHTAEALRHARGALACIEALSPTNDTIRWAWPLAARAAHELRDSRAGTELLALVDRYQPGHLASMLQAERELARVRSAADSGADAADLDDRFTAAIAGQRERSTPYHLALGLLDYSEYLLAQSRADDAAVLIEEAQRLGEALEALPITDRARSLAARPVPTLSGS
ncbi:MAG TPA: hypothetical protein VM712_10925, partial [Gaiellales bacterium]|nr:hypothetical protein [Gaiellales bacterium]